MRSKNGNAKNSPMNNRPNILYVFTDQQAACMMSCAGNPDLKTPAMDSLAARGVRFKKAYCSYPLCTPSRAGMFTGKFPHEVGVNRNGVPINRTYRDDELGWVLNRAGYECAYGGKWHIPQVPFPDDGEHGLRKIAGFDDCVLAEACANFFQEKRTQPFLLVTSFDNPHNICEWGVEMPLPWGEIGPPPPIDQCPQLPANHARNEDEPDAITIHRHYYNTCTGIGTWKTADEWRRLRWAYARISELVDREVGKILDALDKSGLTDNTLVIFSSDHGDQDGAHMLSHKRVLYEESVRVPFIAAGPGVRRNEVDTTHPINNSTDFFATVCDYAGAELPTHVRGRSLRPLLEGNDIPDWPEYVVSEVENEHLHKHQRGRMVRSQRFKYMAYERGRNREQLFDLEADPGEMNNLAKLPEFNNERQRHREYLREWCLATSDTFDRHYARPDVQFMIPGDAY